MSGGNFGEAAVPGGLQYEPAPADSVSMHPHHMANLAVRHSQLMRRGALVAPAPRCWSAICFGIANHPPRWGGSKCL